MADGEPYRAALIGCGRMGTTIDDEVRGRPNVQLPYSHAAGYEAADGIELRAVADLDDERREAARERYDVPAGYDDYREMIDAESPDVLSVATRPGTHAEMVTFAAERGVPAIYCEKPLGRSVEEAERIAEACRDEDVAFNLGVNRRFEPLYRTVRALVREGAVGRRRALIAQCGGSAALWGQSHAADMLLYLAGDAEVDFVQGEAGFDEEDVEGDRITHDPGVTMGYVAFEDGTRGYLTRGSGWEFEVDGEDGKIRTFDNGHGATLRRDAGDPKMLAEEPFPDVDARSGTLGCIEELVAALDGEGTTSAPVGAAARGQAVCMGWLASHRRGGERVQFPLDDDARRLTVEPGDW